MTEEEKSLEELEAEYRAALQKKVDFLKTDNEAREKADQEKKDKANADELEAQKLQEKEDLKKEFMEEFGLESKAQDPIDPPVAPDTKAAQNPAPSTNAEERRKADWQNFYTMEKKKMGIENSIEYGGDAFLAGDLGFAFTDSDSGCGDDVSAWSPADVFCDLVWQAAMCGRQLSGIVTVRACDINVGQGLSVQIRAINADTLGSALGACECATCVSNVFTTYTITLDRYDIYKVVCELDIWDVGNVLKDQMVTAMANGFVTGIDTNIYNALRDATAGFSETVAASLTCDPTAPTSGCCDYGSHLYKEIVELEARMRAAGYGKEQGFYLIIAPRVATYLKYKEGGHYPPWVAEVEMDGNTLVKIGNIKVIEYCGATTCTNENTYPLAIMLDPTRAVGEAYGKKPHLKTDEDPIECDSTKLVYRAYVGIDALDLNAIGHIENP